MHQLLCPNRPTRTLLCRIAAASLTPCVMLVLSGCQAERSPRDEFFAARSLVMHASAGDGTSLVSLERAGERERAALAAADVDIGR